MHLYYTVFSLRGPSHVFCYFLRMTMLESEQQSAWGHSLSRIHQLLQRFVNTQQWLDSAAWSRWSSQDQRAPSHHPYSPTHLQLQWRKEPAEQVPAGSARRGSHGLNRSLCTGPTLRGLTEMSEVEMWKSQRETRRKGLNFSQPRRGKVTYLGIFSHTISVEQDFSAECDRWCFDGLTLI